MTRDQANLPPRRRSHSRADRPVEAPLPRGNIDHLLRPLDAGRFVIFDIESTGGNPERNGITEIFALRYEGGKLADSFYAMVNPEIPIPPIVRKMTGITNQMVRDAPLIQAVMPGFVDFVGLDVLVSHNTIGDMKFLRYFSEKVVGTPMPNYFLCTHLLVEKLAKEAPDKSLKGLAKFFELHHTGDIHRAEGDTYLTLGLFKTLLLRLKDRGIKTIVEGIRFQGDYDSGSRLGWGLSPADFQEVPARPGVFHFEDQEGQKSLIIGAADMAREVRKLQRLNLLGRPLLKLIYACSRLGYQECPNDFTAMLLEAEMLAQQPVRFDPATWHHRVAKFVYLLPQADGSSLLCYDNISAAAVSIFGPILQGRDAQDFMENVAATLELKVGRRGVVLSQAQSLALAGIMQGRRQPTLWQRLRRLMGAGPAEGLQTQAALGTLVVPASFQSVSMLTGILLVAGAKTELHLMVNGIPTGHLSVPEPDTFLKTPGAAAAILKGLRQQSLARQDTPMTDLEALQLTRIAWWMHGAMRREGGSFLPAF